MQVTAQFSIYPLGRTDIGPTITAAVAAVSRRDLEPEVGPMSTLVAGPAEAVFAALQDAFLAAATDGCVLVATISNACPAVPPTAGGPSGSGLGAGSSR